MKTILKAFYLFALVCALMLLWNCSSSQQVSDQVVIETRTDTITVYIAGRTDTVIAEPQELSDLGLVWTGNIVEGVDTIYRIKFVPRDTIFIFEKPKDSLNVVHQYQDTTSITQTTIIEEPTFIEQWWWLILVVLVLVLIIVIKLR